MSAQIKGEGQALFAKSYPSIGFSVAAVLKSYKAPVFNAAIVSPDWKAETRIEVARVKYFAVQRFILCGMRRHYGRLFYRRVNTTLGFFTVAPTPGSRILASAHRRCARLTPY